MSFRLQLRGVMLFELTSDGKELERILIPKAETVDDHRRVWTHPDRHRARAHVAGVVTEGVRSWRVPLRPRPNVRIGTGPERAQVSQAVRDGVPNLRAILPADATLRAGTFLEIIPRGQATLDLDADLSQHPFELRGLQPLGSTRTTLEFQTVPSNSLGHPQFSWAAGDSAAIYNYDFLDPDIRDLNEGYVHFSDCRQIPPDDDFYWLYGLFKDGAGNTLDASQFPVPVANCNPAPTRAIALAPTVSTCFPGRW